jgi:hypothetical protein
MTQRNLHRERGISGIAAKFYHREGGDPVARCTLPVTITPRYEYQHKRQMTNETAQAKSCLRLHIYFGRYQIIYIFLVTFRWRRRGGFPRSKFWITESDALSCLSAARPKWSLLSVEKKGLWKGSAEYCLCVRHLGVDDIHSLHVALRPTVLLW